VVEGRDDEDQANFQAPNLAIVEEQNVMVPEAVDLDLAIGMDCTSFEEEEAEAEADDGVFLLTLASPRDFETGAAADRTDNKRVGKVVRKVDSVGREPNKDNDKSVVMSIAGQGEVQTCQKEARTMKRKKMQVKGQESCESFQMHWN
jgi:hypothetical protein